jgi:hypothetical protein
MNWVWWYTPAIPALRRLRQEALELEASLGSIGRTCLKNETKQTDVMIRRLHGEEEPGSGSPGDVGLGKSSAVQG